MATLQEAVVAMEARKMAVAQDLKAGGDSTEVTSDAMRLMLSGFDVDYGELVDAALACSLQALRAILQSMDPLGAIRGVWADGFATGLLHERMRAEAERVADKHTHD